MLNPDEAARRLNSKLGTPGRNFTRDQVINLAEKKQFPGARRKGWLRYGEWQIPEADIDSYAKTVVEDQSKSRLNECALRATIAALLVALAVPFLEKFIESYQKRSVEVEEFSKSCSEADIISQPSSVADLAESKERGQFIPLENLIKQEQEIIEFAPVYSSEIFIQSDGVVVLRNFPISIKTKEAPNHVDAIRWGCYKYVAAIYTEKLETVSLVRNQDGMLIERDVPGAFYEFKPDTREPFELTYSCKEPGVYYIELAAQDADRAVIKSDPLEIVCPLSFTLWAVEQENQRPVIDGEYAWNGVNYAKVK